MEKRADEIYFIKLNKKILDNEINIVLPKNEIIIDKSFFGDTSVECLSHNIIAVGRKNIYVHNFLIYLACNGFFLIRHDTQNGISTLHKLNDYRTFLSFFGREDVMLYNNIYYTLESPFSKESPKNSDNRLLVIFSSIADFPYNASISRRTFYTNWPKVKNFIPRNTYVLRIADVGGVISAFYLNTKFDNDFENRIQILIDMVSSKYNIKKNNIILYGASKGGTGALYHSIIGGYQCVAVDPIVSDEYYINNCRDQHFVDGIYNEEKNYKFINIINNNSINNINIVTSRNSQQFLYINKLLNINTSINHYIFNNKEISQHTDVSFQTLPFTTTLINSIFFGLDTPASFETDY